MRGGVELAPGKSRSFPGSRGSRGVALVGGTRRVRAIPSILEKKHRVDDENRYREAWRWPRARASTHRCGRARNATRPPRLMAAEKGPCCKGAQERWAKALYSTRSGAQGLSADAGGRERGDPDGGSGRSRLPGSATAVAQRIRTRGSRNDVVAQQLPHMEHRRREECRFLTRPV